jgi:imidazole glycerol-phosphate synthase subunit HisH
MPRIAIIDYGMGNLRSVQKAFEYIGIEAEITADAAVLGRADGAVLPGVGAFADCIKNLTDTGLIPSIKDFTASGRPFLGICLGLQLLFDSSLEGGLFTGLGLLDGQVVPLPREQKVPHMGWNNLNILQPAPLLKGLPEVPYVYFVHSYHAMPIDRGILSATTGYGIEVTAAVQCGNVFATQFHPEKSGEVGLQILRNFGGLL